MGDSVGMHDRRSSQLVVRRVDGLPHQLVEGLVARQNDRRISLALDRALTQAHQVRADAHGPSNNERKGEDLVVGPRRLPSDSPASHE
eukprot:3001237-Prorocentrum_lima.AAC.1